MSFQELADCIKGGVNADSDPVIISDFLKASKVASNDLGVQYFLDANVSTYQAAMSIRGAVMVRVSDISQTVADALAKGYVLPDNPFPTIDRINDGRRLFDPITNSNAATLFDSAVKLSTVTTKVQTGDIVFDRKPAFQIASYEVSVDGLSPQSGDALVDILGYQPDADFIKRKRALDALAKLDFSKRRPYLLFTADLDGSVVISWARMHDASGYKLLRRDVFGNSDLPPVMIDNQTALSNVAGLMTDDRFYQALTFYDWLDHSDVMAHRDETVMPDMLYSYEVVGLQKKSPGGKFVFEVPTSQVFLSPTLIARMETFIQSEADRFGRDPSAISPYPALSQALYGTTIYGWVLAGVNVVAALGRDGLEAARQFGFIGSTLSSLVSLGRSGKLVMPQDVSSVGLAVDDSVSAYGISQTIISVLDGLGMTEFIGGKDSTKGVVGQSTLDAASSGLGRVLAAIDPATATIDPKVLTAGVTSAVHQARSRVNEFRDVPVRVHSVPIDEIVGTQTIDLTTHEGIGRFVQAIRGVYDFYPGGLN